MLVIGSAHQESVSKAKNAIIAAIIGLLIGLGAYVIIATL